MANEVTHIPAEIIKAISTAQRPFREISSNWGNIVTWEEESRFANQAIEKNSLLAKCWPDTIRDAVVNVAAIGLSLNPQRQHCALVPRWNTRLSRYECHADPMYRGLLKIATDGGKVLNVQCGIVYQDEIEDKRFEYRLGTEPFLSHQPDPFVKRVGVEHAVGAYCIADIAGSKFPKIEFMRADEILKVMEASEIVKYARKNKKDISGPWRDWPTEMWKKTVMKRASKTWPAGNGRLEQAIHIANVTEGYIQPKDSDIEGEAVVIKTISESQATELRTLCRSSGTRVETVYDTYAIKLMEQLPIEKFDEVRKRLQTRGLMVALKKATGDDEFYANDYGLTLAQLEGYGAETQTKAKLFSKR